MNNPITFKSKILENERAIWFRQPKSGVDQNKLAIFLDGELYHKLGVSEIIDRSEEANAIDDTLFVFVSYGTVDDRWKECPCYPKFANFIADELLPLIVEQFPSVNAVHDRTLIGLSYTGLAAAYTALEKVGLFNNVIAQSGSLWWNDCYLAKQFESSTTNIPTRFYLDVGQAETEGYVEHKEDVIQRVSQISAVQQFRDVLQTKNIDVIYIEFDGGHDFESWAKTLPGALSWALSRASA